MPKLRLFTVAVAVVPVVPVAMVPMAMVPMGVVPMAVVDVGAMLGALGRAAHILLKPWSERW